MCTAASWRAGDLYFGRTLDYGFSYDEEVTVTPRQFPFSFRHMPRLDRHYAIIGMAYVQQEYPLYYDAVNEKGLAMAGLNFVGNAAFSKPAAQRDNIAVFEFIPWILGQCDSVRQARRLLTRLCLTDTPFSKELPPAQLHWLIADGEAAITVEATEAGLQIYDNPVGLLTNNPPFPQQLFGLNNFMHLSPRQPENLFSDKLDLRPYSRGMGALGLPGDLSSASRFVRAAFVKMNALTGDSEEENASQFFHILGCVEQQNGCCLLENGEHEFTIYTSCCNASRGIYYYTTYQNSRITAVDMHREDLDAHALFRYPLIRKSQILYQN